VRVLFREMRVLFVIEDGARALHGDQRAEERGGSLCRAHDEPPSGHQRLPEPHHGGALGLRREIHQDVAAEDQIHGDGVRHHRRIAAVVEVQRREHDRLADVRGRFEGFSIPVVEVSSPNPFGGVPERPLAIDPLLGHVQRFKVDVGRQNRQGPPRPVGKQTIEDDREGVGLFAGCAPSAPESELQHPLRAARGDEGGKDLVLQRFEECGVAEEVGFADGEVTGQAPPFGTLIRQGCQPCDIRLWCRELRTSAGPKQSPLQVGLTGFGKGQP